MSKIKTKQNTIGCDACHVSVRNTMEQWGQWGQMEQWGQWEQWGRTIEYCCRTIEPLFWRTMGAKSDAELFICPY